MELRKIRDAADARASLSAVDESGLSRPRWARANGINPRSLNAWRLNLDRRKRSDAAPLRLVEVTPISAPVPSTYVISVGCFCIEVDNTFDEATLRRLLAVVSTC